MIRNYTIMISLAVLMLIPAFVITQQISDEEDFTDEIRPVGVTDELIKYNEIMADVWDGNSTDVELTQAFEGVELYALGIGRAYDKVQLIIGIDEDIEDEDYHSLVSSVKPLFPEDMPYVIYRTEGLIFDSSSNRITQTSR